MGKLKFNKKRFVYNGLLLVSWLVGCLVSWLVGWLRSDSTVRKMGKLKINSKRFVYTGLPGWSGKVNNVLAANPTLLLY